MLATLTSRRALTLGVTALCAGLGVRARATSADPSTQPPGDSDALSHAAESIHQEVSFNASCRQVYEALTSISRFDALTRLSDAASLLTAPGAKATAISDQVGGTFTLFGGYITGRHLEMVPDKRLVQAWRAGRWPDGDYSVVRFALAPQGTACKLVFDHRGFPSGQGTSLVYGWRVHYWEPLAKLLAQG